MGDKMTIVGQDGKPKYEISASNFITDLRDYCKCTEDGRPTYEDGKISTCLICLLPILSENLHE